jgi:hypothetical protein
MINSLSDMTIYIKRQLGWPVVNVEVADEQFDQIIEDSIQILHRYMYGDATYRDVLSIQLSANVSAYQLDSSIDSILEIASNSNNKINQLFTPQHTILYNQVQNGSLFGGAGNGTTQNQGGATVMANYNIAMIYLKEISDFFEKKYTCSYNSNNNIMRVWPTPEETTVGMLTVWKKTDAIDLYNHVHMKKLCVAKTMRLWGRILGKNIINLPGGGTIDGRLMLEEGKEQELEVMDTIRMETESPVFVVG